jgi:hypothetical protein
MKNLLKLFILLLAGWLNFVPWVHADGAYRVEITKNEAGTTTVITEPVGGQSGSDLSQTTSVTQTTTATSTQTITQSNTWSPTGTYYTSQGTKYDSGGGFLNALIQILSMVGDIGIYGGYGYWHAPLPTRFAYQGNELWNSQPGIAVTHLGLSINVPMFTFLEFEPYLGLMFGETGREKTLPAGYVKERLLLNETQYGLTCIVPAAAPFFFELGIGGTSTTTTCELETTLPTFNYDGFILDHTSTFQLTYGAGLSTPSDWNVRLRGGLQAYQQFTDFGTSWGMRAYVTFMFSNRRQEYFSGFTSPPPED